MLQNRWVDVPGMSGSKCVSPCVRLRCWQPVSGHASSSTLGNKNLSESGVGMEERKQEAFPHCGHIFRPATFFLFDHSWQQFIINLLTLNGISMFCYMIQQSHFLLHPNLNAYLILMHWWIRQKVSKMNKRAFSMKSSRQATRKKSFTSTFKINKHWH